MKPPLRFEDDMTNQTLHDMPLMPHLIIEGLNRYADRPCLYLGDTIVADPAASAT